MSRASRVTPLLLAVLLALPAAPMPAMAVTDATMPVSSVRSFPAVQPRRDPTREGVASSNQADWGGIETLDIPTTSKPTPRQSRAASRNAARTPVPSGLVDASALSGPRADVARIALNYEGAPYVYGGVTPDGWDCSGFTAYVYAQAGITLPHQSEAQAAQGVRIDWADAQPGDLLWRPGHVGIYLGNGMMIHASTPATGTIVSPVTYGRPLTPIRIG